MPQAVPVFHRGAVHDFFKYYIKVSGTVKACQLGNLIDLQMKVHEILLRLLDPYIVDIVLHGYPQLFLEQAAQIGFADQQIFCDFPQGNIPPA